MLNLKNIIAYKTEDVKLNYHDNKKLSFLVIFV